MVDVAPIPWLAAARSGLALLRARGVHAALLHGPAGTGKWDLALSFAADVLCESAVAPAPACGHCPSCHLLAAGNHPDLRVVTPDALAERRPGAAAEALEQDDGPAGDEGSKTKAKPSRDIRIEQVRDIDALAERTAHRGGARVVVLGPAESLTIPAANALLKVLEEPPPQTVFVLVSDQIDRCLPTVVSRCSLVRVPLPPRAEAIAWLQARGLGAAEAATRLAEAGGAPLLAVRESADALTGELRATLLTLLRQGPRLSAGQVAAAVPRNVPIGASVDLFQRWGWDYFSYRLGGSVRYHPEDVECFRALAARWSLRSAAVWLDALRQAKASAEHPLNARAAVEGVLLEYVASVARG